MDGIILAVVVIVMLGLDPWMPLLSSVKQAPSEKAQIPRIAMSLAARTVGLMLRIPVVRFISARLQKADDYENKKSGPSEEDPLLVRLD